MGRDKATLAFRGRPMVEMAVEKLRGVCAQVSIAGNRDDLAQYAPVVHEERVDCGPAAGIEAGLTACEQPWAMFIPVDVPLVPAELLRRWAQAVAARSGETTASFLRTGDVDQPAFCLVSRGQREAVSRVVGAGVGSIRRILERSAGDRLWVADAAAFAPGANVERLFLNVNTAEELLEAEWAEEADPLRG